MLHDIKILERSFRLNQNNQPFLETNFLVLFSRRYCRLKWNLTDIGSPGKPSYLNPLSVESI